MMLALFLFLILLKDGESSECNSSYVDIIKHLNLIKNKELFAMTRPVKDYRDVTKVTLDVLLRGLLGVKEKEQQLISSLWIDVYWKNEHIYWNPDDFCGMTNISLPTQVLWKPDITIEEKLEKDKAPNHLYFIVESNGTILLSKEQVLVSTCRMQVYKFPFDIQTCKLTFKSLMHNIPEIELSEYLNSSRITKWSRKLMQHQYEWLFINITVSKKTVNNFGFIKDRIIYSIFIKRRSGLYMVNFMLPVLFFLGLDLASFLISDSGGEKLSFKITVLLAVTVLQLILSDILPASSDKIPLIAVYCIGFFSLMLLSILETIVVMYLMKKDFTSQDNNREEDMNQTLSEHCVNKRDKVSARNYFKDFNKCIRCASACAVSPGETPSELLPVAEGGSSSQLTEVSHDLEKITDDLRDSVKTLAVLLNSKSKEEKPGYWNRLTIKINRAFFVFYITAASLFLVYMYICWTAPDDEA